jgi:integrase
MPRTPTPRSDEPIRTVTTQAGLRYRVVLDTSPKGAPRRQVTKTFDTLKQARTFVTETRAQVAGGDFTTPTPETLRDLTKRWLASRVDVRPITRESYRASLTGPLRRLGDRKVQSLTRTDMTGLVSWLSASGGRPTKVHPQGRPLSPRAVRAAMIALSQALDMAVHEGILRTNPARGVKRPRVMERKGTDLEHWQPGDLLKFRDHADADSLAAAWRLTLCGLTRADILGLRWSDVDLGKGTVTVRQGRVALQMDGQASHVDAPKSAQRRRTVPVELIHPGTVALLKSMKTAQAADRLKVGPAYGRSTATQDSGTGYVVVDSLGIPLRPEVYSDRFRRLCVSAEVSVIHLHSVRHSLAFWLHSLGVTPADAAALLGHTVEVHLSTYLPESGATGIERAAALLGQDAASRAATC